MRYRIAFVLVALMAICSPSFSQSATRKLPQIINHPSLNVVAPYISADGNALLFVSDGGQDGNLIVSYTSRESDWSAPVELPKHLNNRLNFLKGYALSADGKKLFITSAKSPVIGGYDIMTSDLKGNTWSMPVNLMLPVNSKTNEACPSLTPDGNTLYFMRCDKMDQYKADVCKIFSSTRKANGQWSEPIELPASINTGNSQTPRILPDGQTLIYASDKNNGKGGMDLYLSRMEGGAWSSPAPLDFVNSEKDDQYVSVSAHGRYLLKEAKGARNNYELTEFLFPNNIRPKSLMKVEGKITGPNGEAVSSYIAVTDLKKNQRIYSGKPGADGVYFFYLPEGSQYELSIDPEKSDITFFSRYFDLMTEKIPQKEKVNAILKKPASGDEIPLDLVTFKPFTAEFDALAEEELERFARLVKANPDLSFDLMVTLVGLREDSIQSSPDLTEIKVDSIVVASDTAAVETTKTFKTTYHNDRTLKQAESINNFLAKEGIKPEQVVFVVNAVASEEQPKVAIKARVR
jgi:hypothetical protein